MDIKTKLERLKLMAKRDGLNDYDMLIKELESELYGNNVANQLYMGFGPSKAKTKPSVLSELT